MKNGELTWSEYRNVKSNGIESGEGADRVGAESGTVMDSIVLGSYSLKSSMKRFEPEARVSLWALKFS